MDALSNLIAPIMVIGTILAIIFALAALWNSVNRRKIIAAAQSEEESITFRPPPADPVPDKSEATPRTATPKPAPAASKGGSLFRQVTRAGGMAEDPVEPEGDLYVWE